MKVLSVGVLAWVVVCSSSAAERAQNAYFLVDADGQGATFVVRLTDPGTIQQARDIAAGREMESVRVMGTVVKAPAFYSPSWSFHLEPLSIRFFSVAAEACDADIRQLEKDLEQVGGALLPRSQWCPWASRLMREISPPNGAALALTAVSAASFRELALGPGSLAAAFGMNLADRTESAVTVPLPTSLAGVSVEIRPGSDGLGAPLLAPLLFVSPEQINFLVPANVPPGVSSLNVRTPDGRTPGCYVRIEPVAPGLFANGGFAAANLVRVRADGTMSYEPVLTSDPGTGVVTPAPIRFGQRDRLFLEVYGTGLRGAGREVLIARIGPHVLPVLYAGGHAELAGLDQVNIELGPALAGAGELDLTIEAEWHGAKIESNPVRLVFGP